MESRIVFKSLGILLLFFLPISLIAQQKIVLCEDPWPPYTIGQSGYAPTGGIAVEYVTELFSRMEGVQLEMILIPWKRCLAEVEEGNIDGVILALYSEERATYMQFSNEPYFINPISLFYLKEKYPSGVQWETYNDLSPYRIGLLRGSSVPELEKAAKDNIVTLDLGKTAELNFRKLAKGRLDLVVSNNLVGNTLAKETGLEGKYGIVDRPLMVSKYYLPFSKKSPAIKLIPQMDKIIREMQAEGVMQKIIEKY